MRKQLSLRAAKQAGFTLIELIIVIVIIGILAAVAIPKYADLTDSANQSALDGVSGNYVSAFAANKALCQAYPDDTAKCTTIASADVCKTATLQALLPGNSGYTAEGNAAACVITQTSSEKTKTVVLP